jgi:hypothetical protein
LTKWQECGSIVFGDRFGLINQVENAASYALPQIFSIEEAIKRSGMPRKISLEEAEKRLKEKHGDNISMVGYVNISARADFECRICGYVWSVAAESVINAGHGCQKCFDARRKYCKLFSYEDVKTFIEEAGCELMSKKYCGVYSKLDIKFPCGHIWPVAYTSFKSGIRCGHKDCRSKNAGQYHAYTEEKFLEKFNKTGMKFIRFLSECKNQDCRFEYECEFGHKNEKSIKRFIKYPGCPSCAMISWGERHSGSNATRWKGGKTNMGIFFRQIIKDWKKESAKNYNYKCAITKNRFDEIHHLQPLNLIIDEALMELNLPMRETMGEYSDEELAALKLKLFEVHDRYPLGVPLKKSIHIQFHKLYGYESTPEDFYDFEKKINSGEITLES